MDDDRRLETLKEAAKLGTFLLDGRVRLIRFADKPTVSDDYQLPAQLAEVCQWIDAMQADGSTNYLPALQAAASDASAIVFVSDGAPSDPPPMIFEHLRSVHAPIHTIAVGTSPQAEDLLAQIAAATEGGFQRTAEPAGKVWVRAEPRFFDASGQVVDPRAKAELSAAFELVDPKGTVVQRTAQLKTRMQVARAIGKACGLLQSHNLAGAVECLCEAIGNDPTNREALSMLLSAELLASPLRR